jgi:hypothetical protein
MLLHFLDCLAHVWARRSIFGAKRTSQPITSGRAQLSNGFGRVGWERELTNRQRVFVLDQTLNSCYSSRNPPAVFLPQSIWALCGKMGLDLARQYTIHTLLTNNSREVGQMNDLLVVLGILIELTSAVTNVKITI